MIYMGCVTDREWTKALLEQYPNRRPGHPDGVKRRAVASECRDIPELTTKSLVYEARRYYAS